MSLSFSQLIISHSDPDFERCLTELRQAIIQAARFIRDYPFLHLIYISNFKCGPDSYIRHYIGDAAGEPFLMLQLDSHANDAGIMTRIEAFLESKGMI